MSQLGHTGVYKRRRSEGRMRWTKPDPSQDKKVYMIYVISFLIMTIMINYNLIFTYALFCAFFFFAVMFLLNTVISNTKFNLTHQMENAYMQSNILHPVSILLYTPTTKSRRDTMVCITWMLKKTGMISGGPTIFKYIYINI